MLFGGGLVDTQADVARTSERDETGLGMIYESIAKGAAGLVLCGLLVMMPQWINKAAHTVAGADATINNTPAQVKFAP